MAKKNIESLVKEQFGSQAQAYITSNVHAHGEDLQALAELTKGHNTSTVLDLGCGGGHVSYAVAPHAQEVVACDISNDMLCAVAAEAERRGFRNVKTVESPAERLPFSEHSFDFVFCRLSAHHWRDVLSGLKETRRVLKPDGRAVFIDIVSSGQPLLDTFLQTIEILRDPSHVRDYSVAEWIHMATNAGFVIDKVIMRRMPIDFASWIARMSTPDVHTPYHPSIFLDFKERCVIQGFSTCFGGSDGCKSKSNRSD